MVRGLPQSLACIGVKRHNPCSTRTAHISQHSSVQHERGRGRTEEALADIELVVRVNAPDLAAGFVVKAMQHTLGTKGEDAVTFDYRSSAGAVIESEVVSVGGLVRELPDSLAVGHPERFNDLLPRPPMEQHQATVGDSGSAEACPDSSLPYRLGPGVWKRSERVATQHCTVSIWTAELRPVLPLA